MYEELKKKLSDNLYEQRYIHSLGVADEAKRLAVLYGADEEKAYLAGLLHDCAKGYSIDEQIKACKEKGISLDSITLKCAPVIHGFLGAELAESEYGITDTEILNAIKYHSVGSEKMTLLEKIIYIADMTEVNRDFDGVNKLREAVNTDLDEAILLSIEEQLARFSKTRKTIHPNIVYMWNDIVSNKNERKRDL